MGTHRHPARPVPGTPEHRAWVLDRIRAYLDETGLPLARVVRDGFVAREKLMHPRANVTTRDVTLAGGFSVLLDSIAAEPCRRSPPPVDVSALDYDDVPDTAPGGLPEAEPERQLFGIPGALPRGVSVLETTARAVEPRELVELQRARVEAAESKRRLDDALRELHTADLRAGVVARLADAPEPQPIVRRERASGLREATAVVLASDLHIEEVVNPRAIEGRNAYSPDIARARIERMAEGALWLIDMHRSRFEIRDLVLWLGGDCIAGYLHEELEETNALSPIEAVLFCHELLAGLIRSVLEKGGLERLIIPANVGNHGRTTHRMRAKTRVENSYEFLLYRHLKETFAADPRVEFAIAAGSHLYLEVYEQTLRFLHGDDVRFWGGVGGVTIPIRKALAAWESFRRADLTVMGHFHQLLHGRDFVVNGSLIGYNEYALSIKAEYEPPQQGFFLLDSRRGRCCATPIWVDDERETWRASA